MDILLGSCRGLLHNQLGQYKIGDQERAGNAALGGFFVFSFKYVFGVFFY